MKERLCRGGVSHRDRDADRLAVPLTDALHKAIAMPIRGCARRLTLSTQWVSQEAFPLLEALVHAPVPEGVAQHNSLVVLLVSRPVEERDGLAMALYVADEIEQVGVLG